MKRDYCIWSTYKTVYKHTKSRERHGSINLLKNVLYDEVRNSEKSDERQLEGKGFEVLAMFNSLNYLSRSDTCNSKYSVPPFVLLLGSRSLMMLKSNRPKTDP